MGWKGTVRSIGAAVREAEREAKRQQRELERQQKQYAKMVELERAAFEVDQYENFIARIVSVHADHSPRINWGAMLKEEPPREPARRHRHEDQANDAFMSFEPGFFDKLLRRVESKSEALVLEIDAAKQRDEAEYAQALRDYEKAHADWEESQALAQRVLDGDLEAYAQVVKELGPFTEISDLGSRVAFEFTNQRLIEAEVHVHGETVIPKESKGLLKSGKLTVKQMPKGKFYELYQDYVASSVLRIAGELLAILPLKAVIVTALDTLLDLATGHLGEQPILSVAIPRETFERLNLSMIDPSDSLQNFVHQMSFKKTKGFSAVERIKPTDVQLI